MLSDVPSSPHHRHVLDGSAADERRLHPRVPMAGTVFVIPRGDPLERFWATTTDISRGGMFVHTVMPLPLYAEVRTRIHLKNGPVVRAQARVVRQEQGRGYGCCFTGFAPESVRELDRWLGPSGGLEPTSGTIE